MLRSSRSRQSGFSLAELLVSLSILAVIMTIVVSNQSSYSESTILSSTVSNIGLDVRQMQVYGISVKEVSVGSNDFSAGYGLAFSKPSLSNGYIAFADRGAKNGIYDGSWTCPVGSCSEYISKTTFDSRIVISHICMIDQSNAEDCTLSRADVSFVRPETDAHITPFDSLGNIMSSAGVKGVRVELTSPSGLIKNIIVYTTGQISIR